MIQTRSRCLGGALVLAACATAASAQDTNYWALQYGPVAQLLGGQVVASSRDLSATYYNPGGLALEEGSTFLLSTESLQMEWYTTSSPDSLKVFDAGTSRFGAAPTLVAGALPRTWLGEKTRMAWSFLTRQQLEVRLQQHLVDPFPLPGGTSSAEFLIADETYENWAGITLSRAVSEHWGVGATLYGVYRGQQNRNELNLQAISADQAALSGLYVTDFNYYHFRALAKLGVAHDHGDLKVGLSVTTPSMGLFGSGEADYTVSLVDVGPQGTDFATPPYLQTLNAEGLTAEYKSSWAIGGGLGWDGGSTQWHTSFEWFAPVNRFDVLEVPGSEATGPIRLSQQLKSVFNVGVGIEHDFREDLSIYGAGFTDFSAAVGDPEVNVNLSNWNLYHVSSGVKFRFAGNRFTLGATFSFGSKARPLPTPVPPGDAPDSGLGTTLDVRYRRVVLLLGFLFGDAK